MIGQVTDNQKHMICTKPKLFCQNVKDFFDKIFCFKNKIQLDTTQIYKLINSENTLSRTIKN